MSEAPFEFNSHQRKLLTAALDQIIPPDEERGLPGAGEVGIADFIEEILRTNPAQQLAVVPGLEAFGALLASTGSPEQAFEQVQEKEPGFVPTVVFHTYSGYYQHPRVMEALGIEPRPPHPQGYEMEPFDPALLAKVRQRGKLYRDA